MKLLIAILSILSVIACEQGGGGDGLGINTGEPTTTEPADEVLNPGDEISMTMGFGIDSQKVNADNITFSCQGEGIDDGPVPIDVIYNSSARKINIVPKQALVSGTTCNVTFGPELNAEINQAQQSGLATGEYLGRVGGNRPPRGAYEYQNATPYVGVYTPPGQEPSTAPAGVDQVPAVSDQAYAWNFTVSSSATGAPPATGGGDSDLPGVGEGVLGGGDEAPPAEEPPAEEPPAEATPTPTCAVTVDPVQESYFKEQPLKFTLKGENSTKGELSFHWSENLIDESIEKKTTNPLLEAGYTVDVNAPKEFDGKTDLIVEAYTENDDADKSENCGLTLKLEDKSWEQHLEEEGLGE